MCADACNREVSSTIGVFTSCSFPSPSPRYLTASPPPTSPSNTSKLKIHHLSARTATQATNFVLTAKGVTCPSAWFHHATVSGASLKLPFPSYDSVSLTLAARTASPSEYLSKHPPSRRSTQLPLHSVSAESFTSPAQEPGSPCSDPTAAPTPWSSLK